MYRMSDNLYMMYIFDITMLTIQPPTTSWSHRIPGQSEDPRIQAAFGGCLHDSYPIRC